MNKKRALLGIMTLSLFFITCKKDDTDNSSTTTTTTTGNVITPKEEAKIDYIDMYVGSTITGFTWNGNIANCEQGTLSQDLLDKTLMRIRYFRKQAGLPIGNITMEADLNAKCQRNALMIRANNAISHTPPTSWKCYTADGALAAQKGNISFGTSDVENIDAWMEDAGSNNAEVGHRRWILFSNATKFGFGCTESSGTLWVINGLPSPYSLPAATPEYIAWPPKGFIPRQVVYPRWSFGVPATSYPFQVDFTNATVSMAHSSGTTVPVNVIYRNPIENSYGGDNTISWEPTGVELNSNFDQQYTVTVNNVMVNGSAKNYTYDVTIFNP
ncbi:MAG: CAP domain-containing protein [Bacteroidota bacterium]